MALKEDIERLQQEANRLREGIKAKIMALPDNPQITRLGDSGKCFTISSKDLGASFSPFYHDYRAQYETLAEVIDKTDPMRLPWKIAEIAATGKLKRGTETLTFNPEVLKNLVSVMYGDPA
jgi:hypothetical protein